MYQRRGAHVDRILPSSWSKYPVVLGKPTPTQNNYSHLRTIHFEWLKTPLKKPAYNCYKFNKMISINKLIYKIQKNIVSCSEYKIRFPNFRIHCP